MTTLNPVQALPADDTPKFVRQLLQDGLIDPNGTITEYGGTSELDAEGQFTVIYDQRDNSPFRVRVIEKPRYLAKPMPANDPSGIPAGTPIYRELPSPAQGGAVGIATPDGPKPKRRRRPRRRKRKGASA